jgi:hypothetical protein
MRAVLTKAQERKVPLDPRDRHLERSLRGGLVAHGDRLDPGL